MSRGKAAKMLLPVLLFFISGVFGIVHAQDVLVLKSGRELKVVITEETNDVIKYREFENSTGPLYSIDKTKVESVRYGRKPKNQPAKNIETPVQKEETVAQTGNETNETLTVKKRYVLQNGKMLSSRQVKTLMEDNQQALDLYTKGQRQCVSSNSCAYGIIGICLGANLATNKMEDHNKKMTILGSALAVSGGLIVTAVVLTSSGKKKIRQAVDIYNSGINKPVSYQLNLQVSPQGVGLALRF